MGGTVRIAAGSILVGVVVLGIKYLAFAVTGSVALYSDALESFVNVATAIAALLAVRLAEQPPDRNHPYGHYKVEYFSAVLAGTLIIVAALLILREAWQAVLVPRTIEAPAAGAGAEHRRERAQRRLEPGADHAGTQAALAGARLRTAGISSPTSSPRSASSSASSSR